MTNVPQGPRPRPLRIGHLADLHLSCADDLQRFDAQLARLGSEGAGHLAITGDLLDRWHPRLLDLALQSLERAGFASPGRLTIVHGNHDLAALGGPRGLGSAAAQALRVFDLPPVLASRRRRFYAALHALHPDHARRPPFVKTLEGGIEVVALDSVTLPVAPMRVTAGHLTVTHAIGAVSDRDIAWLDALPPPASLDSRVLLLHHYPLDTPSLAWFGGMVRVPMAIEPRSRVRLWKAIRAAGVALVLCGHVHRVRQERIGGVLVALQGTSGGAWAGYGSSVYDVPRKDALELHEEAGPHVERYAAIAG